MTPEEQYRQAEDDYNRALDAMAEARASLETARSIRDGAKARMSALRSTVRPHGMAVGGVVFGGGGFVADEVHGGIHTTGSHGVSTVTVVGRIINGGVVKTCHNCGGDRGWTSVNGVMTHDACGARQ